MSTVEHPQDGDMSKAPAFQFYAADFLIGTFDMTAEQVGVYIRLLAFSWDKGPLPKDTRTLASMAGLTPKTFQKAWEKVQEKWTETDAGWVNDRLEAQRKARDAFSQKQAENGKRGAAKRWASHSHRHDLAIAKRCPDDSSSVFDLQSSEEKRGEEHPSPPSRVAPIWRTRSKRESVIPKAHPECDPSTFAACGRPFCVPPKLARAWRQQVDPDRPHSPEVDAYLKRIVASGLGKLPERGPIGAKPWPFWEQHWADEHAGNAPKGKTHASSLHGDMMSDEEFERRYGSAG